MTDPIFDHDKLDVYRVAIEYVADSFRVAKDLAGLHRHARDQWLRAAQSIPLIHRRRKRQAKHKRSRPILRHCPWVSVGMRCNPGRTGRLARDRSDNDRSVESEVKAHCGNADPIGYACGKRFRIVSVVRHRLRARARAPLR